MKIGFFVLLFLSMTLSMQSQSLENNEQLVSLDELIRQLDKGEAIEGKKIEMNEVTFEFGSASLTSETTAYLSKIVKLMTIATGMNLQISGHTDNIGDSEANIELSRKRALTVYNYFIEQGISSTRLSHQGFGDARPIADNKSQAGRDLNRRVEFAITRKEQSSNQAQLQDVILLKDGTKLGAYNIEEEDNLIYYNRFLDNSRLWINKTQVDYIRYSTGNIYYPVQAEEVSYQPKKIEPVRILEWINLNAFYLTLGMRSWSLGGSTIDFMFIDDSPSRDNITNQIDLNRGGISLNGGLEWNVDKVDIMAGLHGNFGKINTLGLAAGIGYRLIENNSFMIRPGLSVFMGRSRVRLGNIENNDLFIQINEQQYFGESISVDLRRTITNFQPHLTVDIPNTSKKYDFRVTLGYNLQVRTGKDRLHFKGDVDDESVEEEKDLIGSGSTFLVDGNSEEGLPVTHTGLFFQVGIAFKYH